MKKEGDVPLGSLICMEDRISYISQENGGVYLKKIEQIRAYDTDVRIPEILEESVVGSQAGGGVSCLPKQPGRETSVMI